MHKKEVFAWGMYDLANTIFSALFVTFFYPFYVKNFLGGNEFQIGLVFGLSMLAVGLLVPIIGAWSDSVGRRMPFIIFFTVVCCLFAWLVAGVSLKWALIAGFLANFSYHAALTTYNAMLPDLGNEKEMGNVSGIGTAMGYFGTLFSLGVAAVVLSHLGWETAAGAKAIFAATGLMFFGLSLFTFFGVKEKPPKAHINCKHEHVRESISEVMKTIQTLPKQKQFVSFLLAMFCYANAINAVIVFLFLFANQQIHLGVKAFFMVYALQSVGAVVGSLIAGRLTDKYGSKRVLIWAGFSWVVVIVLLMLVKDLFTFTIAGVLGGAALAAVWTAQRPKLLELVTHSNIGEFFGFLELTNKFSGIIGPIVFGALARFVSYQAALASLLIFFILGLLILRKVPEGKHAYH